MFFLDVCSAALTTGEGDFEDEINLDGEPGGSAPSTKQVPKQGRHEWQATETVNGVYFRFGSTG